MGLLTYDYQKSRGQSKGNGFVFDCLRATGTIFDCSFCAGTLVLHRGRYSVGLGFCLVCWGGGRRWKVGDSWAEAGGQPAITPRVFTVADERGGSLVRRTATRPSRMDGSTDSTCRRLGGWDSPKGTTVESRKGIKSHMRSGSRSGGGSAS